MGKKYVIYYDEIDEKGFVHVNRKTPETGDRDAANAAWKAMRSDPAHYTNLRPETIEESAERHIVAVAFKIYHYVVEGPITKKDHVKVVSGGDIVELKVLDVDPKDTPKNIQLKMVEEVVRKK